jgi:hypothetical protein
MRLFPQATPKDLDTLKAASSNLDTLLNNLATLLSNLAIFLLKMVALV